MQWLSLILGGGGVAFFVAVGSAVQNFRQTSGARQAKIMDEEHRLRVEARADADWYADLADWWRAECGNARFAAQQGGVTLPALPPLPVRPPAGSPTPLPPVQE